MKHTPLIFIIRVSFKSHLSCKFELPAPACPVRSSPRRRERGESRLAGSLCFRTSGAYGKSETAIQSHVPLSNFREVGAGFNRRSISLKTIDILRRPSQLPGSCSPQASKGCALPEPATSVAPSLRSPLSLAYTRSPMLLPYHRSSISRRWDNSLTDGKQHESHTAPGAKLLE